MPNGTKEYVVELTDEPNKECALGQFLKSLDFLREREEFKTAQLQGCLKSGYGTVCKVLDALYAICAIEITSGPPHPMYKSLLKK